MPVTGKHTRMAVPQLPLRRGIQCADSVLLTARNRILDSELLLGRDSSKSIDDLSAPLKDLADPGAALSANLFPHHRCANERHCILRARVLSVAQI